MRLAHSHPCYNAFTVRRLEDWKGAADRNKTRIILKETESEEGKRETERQPGKKTDRYRGAESGERETDCDIHAHRESYVVLFLTFFLSPKDTILSLSSPLSISV